MHRGQSKHCGTKVARNNTRGLSRKVNKKKHSDIDNSGGSLRSVSLKPSKLSAKRHAVSSRSTKSKLTTTLKLRVPLRSRHISAPKKHRARFQSPNSNVQRSWSPSNAALNVDSNGKINPSKASKKVVSRGILKNNIPLRRSARIAARIKTVINSTTSKNHAFTNSFEISANCSTDAKLKKNVGDLTTKDKNSKSISDVTPILSSPSTPCIEETKHDIGFTYFFEGNDGAFFLLLGSAPTLEALRDTDHIAIDEKFNHIPESYNASVIIHAHVAGCFIPVVFALFSEINTDIYTHFINAVLQKISGKHPNPLDVAVAAKSPMRDILKSLFPEATLTRGKSFKRLHQMLVKSIGDQPSEEGCANAFHAQLTSSVSMMAAQTSVGNSQDVCVNDHA